MDIKKLLLVYILTIICINAKIINKNKINYTLSELQLGTFKSIKYIDIYKKKILNESLFDIYVEKKNYYSIYAVNIKNKNKNKVLQLLKKDFNDAYYISKKKIHNSFKNKKTIIKDININKVVKNEKIKFISKKELTNKYEVAISFFNNKNYEVSYEIFYALFKNNLEDKKINFYLARSAFELKKYNEAYSAFERILIKYPNEIRAKLEIARIDFVQKRYKNSQKQFLELKKQNLPKSVEKKVDMYLSKIKNKIQKNTINGIYVFGLDYDDNINNRANNDKYSIPYKQLNLTNTTKDISSLGSFITLFLNHRYEYSDNIRFRNNILLYGKKVFKDSLKDIGFISYTPSIISLYNDFAIEYALFTNFLKYENEYYMNTYGITNKLSYFYSSKTKIELFLKYQKKLNKIDIYKNKDSIYKSINLNIMKILNNRYTISGNLEYENERKNKNILTNIDFNALRYNFLVNYKYLNNLSFNPSITYKNKKYLDINSLYNKKRLDKEYIYSISTLYTLKNNWTIKTDITHYNTKSNFDFSSYKKNTVSFSFMKRF